MTKTFNLVVVTPVGPNDRPDYVLDTIDSVTHYTGTDTKIILIDDTGGKDTCATLQARLPGLDVVKTPCNYGLHGRHYLTMSLGYLHAYKHYDFKLLLRLDTDALVIGETPEIDASNFFQRHPNVGIIGLYGHGTQTDVDNNHWSQDRLLQESRRKSLLHDPLLCLSLRRLLRRARTNGFQLGDYIFGGSYFMNAECVRRLAEANLLHKKELGRSLLEEDHIFGLLIKSIGIDMADFARGDLPMAMEWKGLPCAPQELIAKKKKITHSTKRWENLNEAEIRKFFRDIRHTSAKAVAV